MKNKNQHFVSQTYLRGFGILRDSVPRAINLLAIASGRIVTKASIKRQCARAFFYGNADPIEKALQFFEGRYGSAMASLQRGEITTGEIKALSQFMFLQYLRTPFQLDERLRVIEAFGSLEIQGKKVHDGLPSPDNIQEIQHQLYIFAKEISVFEDLQSVAS